MIKIYLVDDHPFVLQGLKTFLSTNEEIDIIGEASNGKDALADIKEKNPEIAIVDLHLPDMTGVELTKKILMVNPSVQIIILSSFCEDDEIIAAIDAGALSYLMKDSQPQKLTEAIFAAKKREPMLHPRIAKKLMKRITKKKAVIEPLTSREKDVLLQLSKGKSNKAIGKALFISDKTVKTHISNILRKLDVKDRTQAAIKAIEENLIGR
ncbi:response regulator transcription factor [Halocella sp. SP3-1]|uniref:response regulator n=1 Tax=Halocella sp. SP3-1 TaxID=2382161 RepID=UPI000F759DCD|nr:response regulator transcription factor [Halocella sp. SP3-1]AZO93158.1 DNA-binding response regulator [Halocella sp. SP3-1]